MTGLSLKFGMYVVHGTSTLNPYTPWRGYIYFLVYIYIYVGHNSLHHYCPLFFRYFRKQASSTKISATVLLPNLCHWN